MKKLKNEYQQTHIDRLRLGSFNSMDGDIVADALIDNEKLWDSFMFGRFGNYGGKLIELRDLKSECINADTLMILTTLDRWPALKAVLDQKDMEVNEIGYTCMDGTTWGTAPFKNAEELCRELGGGTDDENGIVVRVWWD
jgi:hypothetical protein